MSEEPQLPISQLECGGRALSCVAKSTSMRFPVAIRKKGGYVESPTIGVTPPSKYTSLGRDGFTRVTVLPSHKPLHAVFIVLLSFRIC